MVASRPAPAHVVLVLELVPAPTSSPGLVSVCHRLVGSRGRLLPASCRGDGAGAVPGAVAPGWQPHPGQVQCPRGLLQAPLLECPAQPETGMRKLLGSISVSLSVSGLGGKVQGTRWNCVCTFEACDRSLFWRISMKRHEKPILLLIWLKQVGHQDGDARSSWQRWLRVVLPPCSVAAEREKGQTRVPRARGAGERWGGPPSDNGVPVYCLGDVPCPCRLQEARSSPVGRGGLGQRAELLGGVSWGWVCEEFVHRARSLGG